MYMYVCMYIIYIYGIYNVCNIACRCKNSFSVFRLFVQIPHTSKEVLPLRPGPIPNGSQPVNVVRPLRPAPSPRPSPRDIKGPRPPLPASKPPAAPPKSPPVHTQKLSPPKKPLPLNPTRSPLVRLLNSLAQSQCPL